MKTSSLAALLLLPLAVLAQPVPLLSIDDPEGDDVGDGTLVYPRDSGYEPGDLDLRSLRVFAAGKELRFEATFRNPIRDPASVRASGPGTEALSVFARRGFYAFNLDLYFDTDRLPGSGNTVTMPGRRATIDAAHAWEKAIVLTPRPELMMRQLSDTLRQVASAAPNDVAASIQQSVFFPTDVRVRGRTISFMVPTSFIDAATLVGSSLTGMVTLAKVAVAADVNLIGNSAQGPLERLTLGAAQPEMGQPLLTMGYSGDRAPATTIVDLLSPDPRQQAVQLAQGGLLTGLNRENKLGQLSVIPATAAVASPVPAGTAMPSGGSWFSRALGSIAGVFGAGAAAAAPPPNAANAANAPSLQSIMAPSAAQAAPAPRAVPPPPPAPLVALPQTPAATAPPASRPAPAAAAERKPTRDAAFYEEQELRLRGLDRLRKGGLISEAEYQQKRQEVLDAL